jgi:hypothetical protein
MKPPLLARLLLVCFVNVSAAAALLEGIYIESRYQGLPHRRITATGQVIQVSADRRSEHSPVRTFARPLGSRDQSRSTFERSSLPSMRRDALFSRSFAPEYSSVALSMILP